MNNRRENYRHEFEKDDALDAELKSGSANSPNPVLGKIISLSAGGAGVQVDPHESQFHNHEKVLLKFSIPGVDLPLALKCVVCHVKYEHRGRFYGLRFLPAADLKLQSFREKMLWRFLMEMQRQSVQKKRGK